MLTSGEVLTQILRLQDRDANEEDVDVVAVHVKNAGSATAQGSEIQEIIVRRGGAEIGRLAAVDDFHTRFVRIPLDVPFAVPDEQDDTITVNYVIGAAVPGHTLMPVVVVESIEPPRGGAAYQSEEAVYPEPVSLYPSGLEIVENVPPPDGPEGGMAYTGQVLLAQTIRCVDQDENTADVTINPIVVRNRGTAIGESDVRRINIRDGEGLLLGTATDVTGWESGGVTVSTLQNNVVIDNRAGEELILKIYVVISSASSAVEGRTVQLETTIFHVEDSVSYSRTVDGEEFEIEINHRPVPDFTFEPAIGNVGVDVAFAGTATDEDGDEIVDYAWDFGERGAEAGAGQNVTHAFAAGGIYEVELTVTDEKGLTGSIAKEVEINHPPDVDLGWTPEFPGVGEDVTFTAEVDDPDAPDDKPYTYAWDFGDENTSDLEAPVHTYDERGTFDVSLTVTDTRGGASTVVLPITVGNLPPEVDFTWTPGEPDVNELVTFTATVTDPDDPADLPYTYAWDFGDEATSDAVAPTHQYPEEGTYTVTLEVTDSRQGRTTIDKDISIGNDPPVVGGLTANPAQAGTGDEVALSATGVTDPDDDPIDHYEWDFGDGATANTDARTTTHIFAAPGTYTVSVIAVDDRGARSAAKTVVVTVTGPARTVLFAFPNPAETVATFTYFLPNGATDPILRIYSLIGELVVEKELPEGRTTFEWDLRTAGGTRLPNGLYFCVVTVTGANPSEVFRLLIVR